MIESDKDRIAELERENARLQEQLDAGTEAGWHALRNERDALRNRIDDAPSSFVVDVCGGGAQININPPRSWIGKRVALVVMEDE